MKALLDEQLSYQIAVRLRTRGLDVDAVGERAELIGLEDEQILDVATEEGRALVTNHIKDLKPIAARRLARDQVHGGLILIPSSRPRSRAAIGALATGIEAVMRANPNGIAGSERWVSSPM